MTNLEFINLLEKKLEKSNNNPLVAKWIFCFVNKFSELDLIEKYSDIAKNKRLCLKLINQYINGKPLARILKAINFYGYNFKVLNHVFSPRLETELLVDKIKNMISSIENKLNILDMCCGTGVIGISLQLFFNNKHDLTLIDVSKKAVKNTNINLKTLQCLGEVYKSDLFHNFSLNKKFNVVVFNPPYIGCNEIIGKNVSKYDPYNALFAIENGLLIYKNFLRSLKNFLDPNFYILGFEIGHNQSKIVNNLIQEFDNELEIEIIEDYNKLKRFIIARKVNV